jgi:endonuclease YncB( thermonuclease family)
VQWQVLSKSYWTCQTPKKSRLICAMRRFILAGFLALSGPTIAAPIDSGDVHVIDGDTIRVHHKKTDVRLVGFNAPETRRGVCEAERELGANHAASWSG